MQTLQIQNKAAKLKLNETVHKGSMDRIVEEINRVFGAKAADAGLVTGEITNCIENAADTLDLEIHSPGGSVMDGYVLYNAIMDMRGRGVYVTAHVTLAASMASVIAMAADKIIMRKGARIMIHEASAVTQGDAAEHANRAELLENLSDEIAGIYADRSGRPKEDMRKLMLRETWLNADDAIELGLADEKFDTKTQDKTMNIIDRLTKPSGEEAQERIVALESQLSDHESVVAEFESKIEAAESALQAASTELVELKSAKETAENALIEAEGKLNELQAQLDAVSKESAAKITELEQNAAETEEKIAAKASELLALQGHPKPVSIQDDGSAPKSHLEIFESLTGGEATAYYKAHRKEILAAQKLTK